MKVKISYSSMKFIKKILSFSELVKIEHTLFSIPFIITVLIVLIESFKVKINFTKLGMVLVCFVCARALGMAFNRIIDYEIDLKNPRTANRPLQQKKLTLKQAYIFTIAISIIFFVSAYKINKTAFLLSPLLLLYMLFYPYTKRFTFLCHFALGIIHGLIPIALNIALSKNFHLPLGYLGVAIFLLISGSDILYAILDYQFDTKEKLYSIPAKFGIKKAINIAFFIHLLSLAFFLIFFLKLPNSKVMSWSFGIILSFIIIFLMYLKLKKGLELFAGQAFFLINVLVGITICITTLFSYSYFL